MPDLAQPAVYKPTQAAFAPETVLFFLSFFARSSEMTDDRTSDQRERERERVISIMPPDARERERSAIGGERKPLYIGGGKDYYNIVEHALKGWGGEREGVNLNNIA